jgi:hypothetical protein
MQTQNKWLYDTIVRWRLVEELGRIESFYSTFITVWLKRREHPKNRIRRRSVTIWLKKTVGPEARFQSRPQRFGLLFSPEQRRARHRALPSPSGSSKPIIVAVAPVQLPLHCFGFRRSCRGAALVWAKNPSPKPKIQKTQTRTRTQT